MDTSIELKPNAPVVSEDGQSVPTAEVGPARRTDNAGSCTAVESGKKNINFDDVVRWNTSFCKRLNLSDSVKNGLSICEFKNDGSKMTGRIYRE